ncbi:glycosyltransferase family 2 protein [Streptomyces sp. INA 01156]
MPYLTRCLESVVSQSLGLDRLEVVAVDDGSTDGTGKELDRFAQEYPDAVRVVHQENSGGPSAPRNTGLELARGRYVIFVDADDHLGTEALERMLAVADEQGSDVVLGRVVGVNRASPKRVFTGNLPGPTSSSRGCGGRCPPTSFSVASTCWIWGSGSHPLPHRRGPDVRLAGLPGRRGDLRGVRLRLLLPGAARRRRQHHHIRPGHGPTAGLPQGHLRPGRRTRRSRASS